MKYLNTDIVFTEDGDFIFDESKGDLQVVNNQYNELLLQTILKRLQSSDRDWGIQNIITSDIEYLRGESNIDASLEIIRFKVAEALLGEEILKLQDIDIEAEKLNDNDIGVFISIRKKDSSLSADINLGLVYDIKNNRFVPQLILGR